MIANTAWSYSNVNLFVNAIIINYNLKVIIIITIITINKINVLLITRIEREGIIVESRL
jgi:hypothetical protein